MTKTEVNKFVQEAIRKHPHLKEEIIEIYELFLSEVDEGGSVEHEGNLCISDIKQLTGES